MMKKVFYLMLFLLVKNILSAQIINSDKFYSNGIGNEIYFSESKKYSGFLVTPTYWLEGDYSLQFCLSTNHMFGIGITKDGPLKDLQLIKGKTDWQGYDNLASPEPDLGFSLLYQYKMFYGEAVEGFYGAYLFRFRKYVTEINSFDGQILYEPLRDKYKWINFGYQMGYCKNFKSNFMLDIYGGLGARLEFMEVNNYFKNYIWGTNSYTYIFDDIVETHLRFVLNTGVRVGYAF